MRVVDCHNGKVLSVSKKFSSPACCIAWVPLVCCSQNKCTQENRRTRKERNRTSTLQSPLLIIFFYFFLLIVCRRLTRQASVLLLVLQTGLFGCLRSPTKATTATHPPHLPPLPLSNLRSRMSPNHIHPLVHLFHTHPTVTFWQLRLLILLSSFFRQAIPAARNICPSV